MLQDAGIAGEAGGAAPRAPAAKGGVVDLTSDEPIIIAPVVVAPRVLPPYMKQDPAGPPQAAPGGGFSLRDELAKQARERLQKAMEAAGGAAKRDHPNHLACTSKASMHSWPPQNLAKNYDPHDMDPYAGLLAAIPPHHAHLIPGYGGYPGPGGKKQDAAAKQLEKEKRAAEKAEANDEDVGISEKVGNLPDFRMRVRIARGS